MREMNEDEYFLYVNVLEGAALWSILADRSGSEDEAVWEAFIPVYSDLLIRWVQLGYVKLVAGEGWTAAETGRDIPQGLAVGVLADTSSWRYVPEGGTQICVVPGEVRITDHLALSGDPGA
ncbi:MULTISPECIES: hypothetical protein [unclassified Streptomyces]|uniref:hypothetical protein n=1 Tax=unclassified Streptomyces TaxID=2593676 RepID=UPI001160E825|nr:hypothetical protein [Streptomyces sp. NBRC 110465]